LGDLYLWTGQYEKAANEYHDLMVKEHLVLFSFYRTYYAVAGNAFTGGIVTLNNSPFRPGSAEYITNIVASNEHGLVMQLDSMNRKMMFKATDVLLNKWASQRYYQSATLDTLGDLRSWINYNKYAYSNVIEEFDKPVITKYLYLNPQTIDEKTSRQISVYRTPLLYLRYAEAVNRLGKPNLAMAVLKNGLTSTNISTPSIVPVSEIGDVLPNYMDFRDPMFNNSFGLRYRSLGNAHLDPQFIIPDQITLDALGTDSIGYMEDLIVTELALETAFEGNRFHDLMRIAMRRNDASYLANKVAAKHKGNEEAIRAKLMNRDNWYLKQP
jgi:starch-binding outer membrane protein, SusD/RagB family